MPPRPGLDGPDHCPKCGGRLASRTVRDGKPLHALYDDERRCNPGRDLAKAIGVRAL